MQTLTAILFKIRTALSRVDLYFKTLTHLALLLSSAGATTAWSKAGDAFAINCVACTTSSDFVNAAKYAAWNASYSRLKCDQFVPQAYHNASGTYIIASQSAPLTALVDIRGYVGFVGGNIRGYSCNTGLYITSATAIDMSGKPITSDAQLRQIEAVIYGGSRQPTGTPKLIDIPASVAISPMAIQETFEPIMSNAVAVAVTSQLHLNLMLLPEGTVVEVRWSDGSKAKFIKGPMSPSLTMWTIIPGTLTNSAGQRINLDGSLAQNLNIVPGAIPGYATNVFATPNPIDPFGYFPNSQPIGIVTVGPLIPTSTGPASVSTTINWSDGSSSVDTVFLPSGGGP